MNLKKKRLNIQHPDARRFFTACTASFVGMIIALSWSDLLQNLVSYLKEDFPLLSMLGGVFAAIILTSIAIGIGIVLLNSLDSPNTRRLQSLIDGSLYWKIMYYSSERKPLKRIRYYTYNEIEDRIIKRGECNYIYKNEDSLEIGWEDIENKYILKLIPIEKKEYVKSTERISDIKLEI